MSDKFITDLPGASSVINTDLLIISSGGVDYSATALQVIGNRGGPWTDVLSLSNNPGGVTDWGPIINSAYQAGAQRFVFRPMAYPFVTPLNFDSSFNVTLEGQNGRVWPGNNSANRVSLCYLLWKGSGSGFAISAVGSTGFTISNLGVYYDNAGYTGTLIGLGNATNVTATALIDNCVIRSIPTSGLFTARAIITLDQVISTTIQNSVIGFAEYCITGVEHSFSNANRILNNTFVSPSISAIGNMGDQWTIDSNIFEMSQSSAPAVLACIGTEGANFTFSNNWIGDYSVDAVPFVQSSGSNWFGTFSGNSITRFGSGLIWYLSYGGVINIVNNPSLVNGAAAIVDLVSPSPQKELVWQGNFSAGTSVSEAILNRSGHRLWIRGNDNASILGLQEIEHERVCYPLRQPRPTVVASGNLGSGSSVAIYGTDTAGQISLGVGSGASAGTLATVTFGTLPVFPLGSPVSQPTIILQPYLYTTSVDAGLYISAVSSTGFSIGCVNVPMFNIAVFYRVIFT